MIQEALEYLAEQVEKSRNTKPLSLATNDPSKVYVTAAAGEIKSFDVAPPPRQHTCATISSFTGAAARYGTTEPIDSAFFSSVWVGLDKAVAVLNDGTEDHRHERVSLPLFVSPLFATLRSAGRNPMSQSQLLQLLRHDLATAEASPADVDLAVRKLKFVNHQEIEGESLKNSVDRMG